MATLGVLRKSAKDLGIAPGDIRSATSAAELQALIIEALNGGTTKAKTPKTSTSKPAARKASTSTRTATRTTAKSGTAKRGRPAVAAAAKSKPAVKSAQGKAKRSTSSSNGDSGRHMLSDVNYNLTDGWNARQGSAPDLIVSALRRFKGNREKVFNHLLPNIWEFVGKKMADGSKRTKDSAETMLRYRISRTAWDFAMKTGQHEKSENRAEYGTQGTYKKAGAATKPVKATGARRTAAKSTTATKPARTAAKPQRAAQKRTAAPKTRTVAKAAKKPVAKKKTAARR